MFTLGLSAQVYVDADATGSGDGTSWDNAYTNLNDALLAAASGSEVWIADGLYITPDSTSFFIDKELTVIGGFNGTEDSADDADSDANVVILSGDVMQNDVQGTYDSVSRADNQRVLFLQDTNATSAYTISISGLTIQDGNAEGFVEGSLLPFAGGGILSFANVAVSDVTFRANHADFGSAVATLFNTADNSEYDNIEVVDNYTGNTWMFYNRLTDGITIKNSTFSGANEGTVASGMVFALDVLTFNIEDSDFSDISTTNRGAAISSEDCGQINISGCTVTDCEADLGGGFYLRNFNSFADADGNVLLGSAQVEDCTLTGIGSQRWGGGIFTSQISSNISKVTLDDLDVLQAGGIGGALYLQSNADVGVLPLTINWSDITIANVEANSVGGGIFMFVDPDYEVTLQGVSIDNVSIPGSGGGLYVSGGGPAATEDNFMVLDNVDISNCVANAAADGSGGFGAGSIFFGQDVNISNSTFTSNESALDGGNGAGVYGQGDGITINVTDSEFSRNRALSGSGLAVFGRPINVNVSNSTFDRNGRATVAGNAFRGGGIAFLHGENSVMVVDSCVFTGNAITQEAGIVSGGGAMWTTALDDVGGNLTVSNTDMFENIAEDDADGGAVYFIDGITATFDNIDVAFNTAQNGGGFTSFLFEIPDTVDNVPLVSLPAFDVEVTNAMFRNNSAGAQGGAITTFNSLMSFTNTTFALNAVGSDGAGGGAIIFNGAGPNIDGNNDFENASPAELSANIVNCTFFGNTDSQADGAVGNAIAIFQPQNPFSDDVQSITLTLQNNAFFQEADDQPAIELEPASEDPATAFGDVTINSLGGNFFNVENGENIDLGDNGDVIDTDVVDAELLFEDPFENESEFPLLRPNLTDPESDNPLIDAGTTGDLVPATGIAGNPRGETPDIGAYELDWGLTDVQTVAESGLDVDFFPNPTVDVVNIRSNDRSIRDYTVILTDANGRTLRSQRFNGTVNALNLTDVPTGVYTVQLVVNGNVYSQQVVKQ